MAIVNWSSQVSVELYTYLLGTRFKCMSSDGNLYSIDNGVHCHRVGQMYGQITEYSHNYSRVGGSRLKRL